MNSLLLSFLKEFQSRLTVVLFHESLVYRIENDCFIYESRKSEIYMYIITSWFVLIVCYCWACIQIMLDKTLINIFTKAYPGYFLNHVLR